VWRLKTPVRSDYVDRMGLGFFLGNAAHPDLFGHIGDDEGFQAMLPPCANCFEPAMPSDSAVEVGFCRIRLFSVMA
jgi:hypothetical protein